MNNLQELELTKDEKRVIIEKDLNVFIEKGHADKEELQNLKILIDDVFNSR